MGPRQQKEGSEQVKDAAERHNQKRGTKGDSIFIQDLGKEDGSTLNKICQKQSMINCKSDKNLSKCSKFFQVFIFN